MADSASTVDWPERLAGTPSVAVIDRAIERRRLSHSLLITGDDHDLLVQVAHAIADRLLNPVGTPPERRRPVHDGTHPDCFTLRPAGKMRQIGAEPTRELIGKVQVSATAGAGKVAIIHECDRMNISAANIFLKTLEEPPANTTLLLLTSRPYSLLPTIRSRCLNFRFPVTGAGYTPDGWSAWLDDYQGWLTRLSGGVASKTDAADAIMTVYGLTARFGAILDFATDEQWKEQKKKLPEDLSEAEQVAIETGIANGLRTRLFAEIEHATSTFARARLAAGDDSVRRAFTDAIVSLEHHVGLLRLNLNESAALEGFLLNSLRLWTRKV